ncbi:DUF2569 family protein [Zavarzinia sp. CC-PAN008]|uniref:DUF2569 family protein n=1 Tax=Zavarzinia sp. CC-PAN008 TaxID=3243332 RepID=UPI003F746736
MSRTRRRRDRATAAAGRMAVRAGTAPATRRADDTSETGLGGWMLLMGVATFLRPMIWAWGAWQTWRPLAALGPDHPANGLLAFEFVCLVALAGAGLWAIILMMTNRRLYPPVLIATWSAAVLFAIADAVWARALAGEQAVAATNWQIAISAILAAIGIPYLLRSRRVRRTFVD